MNESRSGGCDFCEKPGIFHVCEVRGDQKVERHYCFDHAPPELRRSAPFGPDRTPTEEAAFLRKELAQIDLLPHNDEEKADFKAEIEQLIADIEAERRRLCEDE